MMKNMILCLLVSSSLTAQQYVFPHQDLPELSMYGNTYKTLSKKSMGAGEFEIWRTSINAGSRTPKHVHETEEVFILLKGEIMAIIGEEEVKVTAPATLICPANIPHQLINIGKEPTDQILVLGIDSKITDLEGKELKLPWR